MIVLARSKLAAALASWLLLLACAAAPDTAPDAAGGGQQAGQGPVEYPESLPYARTVESFTPGEGAGFGQDALPDVVLGPPSGKGTRSGSLDVLSLGAAGEIVLGFGEREIVDETGADFIVFENAFWPGGEETQVYAELGEVSVSADGQTWLAFPCSRESDPEGHFPGCAGVTPSLAFDPLSLLPLDPEQSGGDAFDLAEVGLDRARFVKIRDLETLAPAGNSSGFDLDAIGLTHQE